MYRLAKKYIFSQLTMIKTILPSIVFNKHHSLVAREIAPYPVNTGHVLFGPNSMMFATLKCLKL